MMFSYDKKWEHQFCTKFIWKQNCCHGNCTMSVILHLVWCILQVASFKSTALIFLKMFYILWFVFLWNHWWRHQFLNKNLNISGMRSNISKTKTPFFFCSKGLANKLHLFFYFMSTLTGSDLNRLSCWTHNSNISWYVFLRFELTPTSKLFRESLQGVRQGWQEFT